MRLLEKAMIILLPYSSSIMALQMAGTFGSLPAVDVILWLNLPLMIVSTERSTTATPSSMASGAGMSSRTV